MLVCSLFPAPYLYPSDTEQTPPIRVGMQGLRHKLRHKFRACADCSSGTSRIVGVGEGSSVLNSNCWILVDFSDFSSFEFSNL